MKLAKPRIKWRHCYVLKKINTPHIMKIITFFCVTLPIVIACNNEPKMNKQEEQAVEQQMQKDQQAMDSLEKAIQAQINGTDTLH